jgi:Na+-driven multidrug efflux pump
MSLASDLLAKPARLTPVSRYTVLNGVGYLAGGTLLLLWPGVTQALFRDPAFAGQEEALMRVIGLTVVLIGWFYVFGGRSGSRQVVAASIIDRLLFVPGVLVPLALIGVFPHLLLSFAVLDASLALGAWALLRRERPSSAGR